MMKEETIEVKRIDGRGDGSRKTIKVLPLENGGKMIFIAVQIIENFVDNPGAFYVDCYRTNKDGKLVEKSTPILGF